MSLIGDAMSHAVLPGAAIGFLVVGLSLPAMGLGGLVAGLAVALLSGLVSRTTELREDASFAGFYLASLAAGVLIVSLRGSNIDLLHVLFGTILAIDLQALYVIGADRIGHAADPGCVYRPLVAECFDPGFMRAVGGRGALYHLLFLFLVVINLVAGFQALGTLMAVGLDDATCGRGASVGNNLARSCAAGSGDCLRFGGDRSDQLLPTGRRFGASDHIGRELSTSSPSSPAEAAWCAAICRCLTSPDSPFFDRIGACRFGHLVPRRIRFDGPSGAPLHLGGMKSSGKGASVNSSAIARPRPIRIPITRSLAMRIGWHANCRHSLSGPNPGMKTTIEW